ncbi:MAG: hypothetical protein NVS4B6_27060 [Mycobacterium sp.]
MGTGLNLSAFPEGVSVTGIDLSEAMLNVARTRVAQLGPTAVTLLQGDAHALPFGTNPSTPRYAHSGCARSRTAESRSARCIGC